MVGTPAVLALVALLSATACAPAESGPSPVEDADAQRGPGTGNVCNGIEGHPARSDSYLPGAPAVAEDGDEIELALRVVSGNDGICQPVTGANVEIWHTGDSAEYDPMRWRTTLRTDRDGYATYRTMRPTASEGMAHFHIRVAGAAGEATEWVISVPDHGPGVLDVDLVLEDVPRDPAATEPFTDV